MKLAAFSVTAILVCAMAAATAGAATMKEVDRWLASTAKVIRMPSPGGPPAGTQRYVRIAGTDISGWIDATLVDHGFLQNKQEVMLIPMLYGQGVTATLVFTRLGGRIRYAGLIPSRDGRVEVLFTGGAIVLRTSIYKPNDEEAYPSGFHYERETLRGLKLVKLSQYDTKR